MEKYTNTTKCNKCFVTFWKKKKKVFKKKHLLVVVASINCSKNVYYMHFVTTHFFKLILDLIYPFIAMDILHDNYIFYKLEI